MESIKLGVTDETWTVHKIVDDLVARGIVLQCKCDWSLPALSATLWRCRCFRESTQAFVQLVFWFLDTGQISGGFIRVGLLQCKNLQETLTTWMLVHGLDETTRVESFPKILLGNYISIHLAYGVVAITTTFCGMSEAVL